MQKLDLIKYFSETTEKLKSHHIANLLDAAIKQLSVGGGNKAFDGKTLVPLLFESKSGFDSLWGKPGVTAILQVFGAEKIYASQNIAVISHFLSQGIAASQFLTANLVLDFIFLHNDLTRCQRLIHALLGSGYDDLQKDKGASITVLQVSAGESPLPIGHLMKVLKNLTELLGILNTIYNDQTEPVIEFIDSGSPIGLGIKTSAQVAGALSQLFEKVWDFVISRRHYRHRENLASLTESLAVLEVIRQAEASGTLSKQKAHEYSTVVLRRTDALIALGVLPKAIVDTETTQKNVELLKQYDSIKLLKQGAEEQPAPISLPGTSDGTLGT